MTHGTKGEQVHEIITKIQKHTSFIYANKQAPEPEKDPKQSITIKIYMNHAKSKLSAIGAIEVYNMDGDYFYQTIKTKFYGHHAQKAHLIGELLNEAQQSQHFRKSIPSFPVYARGLGEDLDTLRENGFLVVNM